VPAVSLLLEALKKAELAKQQGAASQPGEAGPPPADAGASGLSLEPQGDQSERALITRDRLPDITQPLEILSEDLPSAGVRRDAVPAGPAAASEPSPSPQPRASTERPSGGQTAAEAEEKDRLSARQLFEAKDVDYNPRRTFYLAVGVLGAATLGVVGYFLYQIYAPRPSFYTGPPTSKPAQPIATAPVQPASSGPSGPAPTPAPAPPAQPSPAVVAAPGPASGPVASAPVPPQPSTSSGATPAAPTRSSGAPSRVAPPRSAPDAAEPEPARAARTATPAPPAIRVTPPSPRLEPGLDRAWQALQAGNFALAKDEYLRVLATNPRDRDALLGLATIDARSQDFESAEARYLRVLELDPRDSYAQAGLIALRGLTDPVQSESRLKTLLAQQPDSTLLHYALGNLYAVQARWPDAQGAYFRAFSGDPESADYAYNLAVSLDNLHQPKLALEYYQRALALAGNRAVGFNSAQVEARVRELTR
jgi:Tfp pilus assembly protein PilF